eukprot:scaffold14782_cov174-Amphora_coffeaeformis.AAC.6
MKSGGGSFYTPPTLTCKLCAMGRNRGGYLTRVYTIIAAGLAGVSSLVYCREVSVAQPQESRVERGRDIAAAAYLVQFEPPCDKGPLD